MHAPGKCPDLHNLYIMTSLIQVCCYQIYLDKLNSIIQTQSQSQAVFQRIQKRMAIGSRIAVQEPEEYYRTIRSGG